LDLLLQVLGQLDGLVDGLLGGLLDLSPDGRGLRLDVLGDLGGLLDDGRDGVLDLPGQIGGGLLGLLGVLLAHQLAQGGVQTVGGLLKTLVVLGRVAQVVDQGLQVLGEDGRLVADRVADLVKILTFNKLFCSLFAFTDYVGLSKIDF